MAEIFLNNVDWNGDAYLDNVHIKVPDQQGRDDEVMVQTSASLGTQDGGFEEAGEFRTNYVKISDLTDGCPELENSWQLTAALKFGDEANPFFGTSKRNSLHPRSDQTTDPLLKIQGERADGSAINVYTSLWHLSVPDYMHHEFSSIICGPKLSLEMMGGVGGMIGAKDAQFGSGGLGSQGSGLGGGGTAGGLGGLGTKGRGSAATGYETTGGHFGSKGEGKIGPIGLSSELSTSQDVSSVETEDMEQSEE